MSAGVSPGATAPSRRPRVLVCDGETQILRAPRVILRDAGFEALPASSGEEALDVAAVSRPVGPAGNLSRGYIRADAGVGYRFAA
jgi:PleD family two-component response regulator